MKVLSKTLITFSNYSNVTFTAAETGEFYLHFRGNATGTSESLSNSNIQLEKSSNATTYEPYKSNILTTAGKNLFNMNRPYDAITDSQATVVQDTNQITVSSAESGIYVNANFIWIKISLRVKLSLVVAYMNQMKRT